jgi:hypothetical protein
MICCPVYNKQAIYPSVVIPAKAGIQASFLGILDSRLRGNDGAPAF